MKDEKGYAIVTDELTRQLKPKSMKRSQAEEQELKWFPTKSEAELYLENLWEIE